MGRSGPPPSSRRWASLLDTGDGTGGLGDRYRLRQLESVRATKSPESSAMGDCDESEVLITALLVKWLHPRKSDNLIGVFAISQF